MPSEAAAATESRRRPAAEMEGPEELRREKCPRCESRDTKFCYYNNYNTSQPRHFCRSCRRYWTLGGSLRNVPIGGSSRSPAAHNPTIHHNHPNKRLRTAVHDAAPPPLLPLRHVAPLLAHHQLVGGPGGYQLAALGEPFRFELGLGMGPMGFMWASEETWRMEGGGGGGGGECYAAAAPVSVSVSAQAAEVSGGPDGDRVR